MENKGIKNFNQTQKELTNEYIHGSIKYPLRFFTLLLLAGMPTGKAQALMFNIKNAMRRSANIQVRKQLIDLLKTLIDITTTDTTIYARLRNMALSHKLGGIKEEVKVYLECLGITNKNEITEEIRAQLEDLLVPIEEDAMGCAGTGLGTVGGNSPIQGQGIDSFDPLLFKKPIKRLQTRKKKI